MREEDTPEGQQPQELIGAADAAEMLGCSRTTVHNWITSGELEAFTVPGRYRVRGRKVFVRRADIERRLLERHRRSLDTEEKEP
jgi:excisionase family DNA binding protein